MRRSRRRSTGPEGSLVSSVMSSAASIAGTSHATRIAASRGSQIRRAMLSAMTSTTAAIGGQRDSPDGIIATPSGTGSASTAWV